MPTHTRAPRNRTLALTPAERKKYSSRLKRITAPAAPGAILDSVICQDAFEVFPLLPGCEFDLVFADPPYNMTKNFRGNKFARRDLASYESWLESWIPQMKRLLKPHGSIYVCGDWASSPAICSVLARHFKIRNRITWERDKGRGASRNWKNNSEDIWFATVSDNYVFNVDAVKLKRRVLAPYTDSHGRPRDWQDSDGGRFRVTHPSNIWTDLTVPFWSMPENTDHPTQKPEKLLARIILASTDAGGAVFDPFSGTGATCVAAKKLGRRYTGVEIDREYCCLAMKRLESADSNPAIQGYADGVFWERNTLPCRHASTKNDSPENGK